MAECDICAKLAEMDDKLSILLTGVGKLVAALPPAGNYWNPADKGADVTLANGDTEASNVSSTYQSVRSVTAHSTGKRYAEFVVNMTGADSNIGLMNASADLSQYVGADADGVSYYTDSTESGNINEGGNSFTYGAGETVAAGDVVGIALDVTAGRVYFAINNTWINSADPAAGTDGYAYSVTGPFLLASTPGDAGAVITLRTADGDFTYTPPTGFTAWG